MRCRFFFYKKNESGKGREKRLAGRQPGVLEMAGIKGQRVYETTRKLIG
jgi:hypothetical protein